MSDDYGDIDAHLMDEGGSDGWDDGSFKSEQGMEWDQEPGLPTGHGVQGPGGLTDPGHHGGKDGGKGGGGHGGGNDNHQPNFKGEGMRIKLARVRGATDKKLVRMLPFYFQAPPMNEFAPSYSHTHTEYTTIGGVTFSRSTGDGLATLSMETVNTVERHAWTIHDRHYRHGAVRRMLKRLKSTGTPIRVVTWAKGQKKAEFDMAMTLRSFTETEKAGEGDARYYSLEFVQWRDATNRRTRKGEWPQMHKLRKGETLSDLARKYYHKVSGVRTIGNANKGLHNWGPRHAIEDHRLYKPGDMIKIPEPPQRVKGGKGAGKGGKTPVHDFPLHQVEDGSWVGADY